jgi:hypothetical protein
VDPFRSQVAWLVVKPESPPVILYLSEVFRLIEQLLHPDVRIARVLIDHATAVASDRHECNQPKQKFTEHNRLRAQVIPHPADDCRSSSPTGPTADMGYIVNIGTSQFILEKEKDFLARKVDLECEPK